MGELNITPVVGLEIHVQLATRSKLFCNCAVEFGAEPNSRVCPVCLGLPGALPVMNMQAVEFAIAVAVALQCAIARHTKWDRKSYFYPDLPKNYQISQYDLPLAEHGYFEIPSNGATRRVRVRRVHLEEDAGKNIHDTPGCTLVDLNRTGTPLLEIVTEPDITSADEAHTFCTELQRLVTYLGVSDAVMQKGQMRFEPNVNVIIRRDGTEYRTPIAEVKNLNSFRAVRSAILYEVRRQTADWEADHDYVLGRRPNENRGWIDDREVTEFQRGKEEAHDYRYFPEPDLVPVKVDDAWLARIRSRVAELPLARRARFASEYGLAAKDADTIVSDRATADLFEAVIEAGAPVAIAGKQFVNLWLKMAHERGTTVARLGVDAGRMSELAGLVDAGTISATAANRIAQHMPETTDPPEALAKSMGLIQVQDAEALEGWIDEVFAANAKAVRDALTNPKKAPRTKGFLRGQVMRVSAGQADPRLAGELIEQRLQQLTIDD